MKLDPLAVKRRPVTVEPIQTPFPFDRFAVAINEALTDAEREGHLILGVDVFDAPHGAMVVSAPIEGTKPPASFGYYFGVDAGDGRADTLAANIERAQGHETDRECVGTYLYPRGALLLFINPQKPAPAAEIPGTFPHLESWGDPCCGVKSPLRQWLRFSGEFNLAGRAIKAIGSNAALDLADRLEAVVDEIRDRVLHNDTVARVRRGLSLAEEVLGAIEDTAPKSAKDTPIVWVATIWRGIVKNALERLDARAT